MAYPGHCSPYSDFSLSGPPSEQAQSPACSSNSDSLIGLPIHYSEGKFRGRTMRSELIELQQAEIGRKFAKVDRRPLDPPPVALLRLFEVFMTPHGPVEQEVHSYGPDNIPTLGMICTVDLFPAPPPYRPSVDEAVTCHNETGKLITEYLVGSTSVEPVLIPYRGKNRLLFAFPDLAVRKEGFFSLRYRMFDIFSCVAGSANRPIQAEVYGGTFQVFSTRQFPGLCPSTDLSKLLQRFGVKVTTRDRDSRKKDITEMGDMPAQTDLFGSQLSSHVAYGQDYNTKLSYKSI